jgi:hypothetical protein
LGRHRHASKFPSPTCGRGGQGVRAFGAVQRQKTTQRANVLSAHEPARGRGESRSAGAGVEAAGSGESRSDGERASRRRGAGSRGGGERGGGRFVGSCRRRVVRVQSVAQQIQLAASVADHEYNPKARMFTPCPIRAFAAPFAVGLFCRR